MDFEVTGFNWDRANRNKCRKHGVSIAEIEAIFSKSLSVFPDPVHSKQEERFKAIGWTEKGRCIFVVFTLRKRGSDTLIRPISARYMHRKEVEHYEKETAEAVQQHGSRALRRDR
jgi:uncharacterized DUF497 family protein